MIKLTLRRFLKLRRAALLIPIVIISLLIFNRLDLSRILKLTLFGPSLYELNQRSADVLFTHYNKNAWGLSEEEIDNLYSKWNAALASAEKSPEFTLSRGIVYSSFPGNVRLTIKSIKLLRHFGCALPIHVYHGSELGGEDISQFLQLVNVSVIDIKEKLRSMGITIPKIEGKQFHFKSAAIIYSDFKEVLFIDNDNIPIRDPTFLFSDPNYISTGTIFWKDLWKTHPDNPIHKILHIPVDSEFEQESGQLVLNKSHPDVFRALQLAFYMQLNADIYFKFLMGDKDTFKYAFKALKLPYYLVESYLSPISYQVPFKGSMMGQYAPNSTLLLFIHQNLMKYENHDLSNSVTFQSIQRYEDPVALYGVGKFRDSHIFLDEYYDHQRGEVNRVLTLDFQEIYPGFEEIYDLYQ